MLEKLQKEKYLNVSRFFRDTIKNKFIEMKLPTFYHPGVFAKVRESFGGCIRFLATGVPLSMWKFENI
jgi:hypothetical protein